MGLTRGWKALVVAALVLASMAPATSALALPRAQTDQATVTVLEPSVAILVAYSGELRLAVSGDLVQVDDRVLTGTPGRALITFFDGSEMEMQPGTEVLLRRVEESGSGGLVAQLAQATGVSVNRVAELANDSSYQLQTPNTTALVRGTVFSAAVVRDPASGRVVEEQIAVEEGTVEVRLRREVRHLEPGESLTVRPASGGGVDSVSDDAELQGDGGGRVQVITASGDQASATPTPTGTATVTASATPDEVTPTPTGEATPTPIPTEEATATPTATESATPTEEATPTPTEEATPTPTEEETPTPTATESPTPTETESPTPTATEEVTPTPTATDEPLSGPVGHWLGDGNAANAVGGALGLEYGGLSYVPGVAEQAFQFNGTDSSVSMGAGPELAVSSGDFTVSTWVYFDSVTHAPGEGGTSPGDMSLVDKMGALEGAPNAEGWRVLKQADNRIWFCLGAEPNGCSPGSPTTVQSATVVVPGVWYHVTAVKRGAEIAIYVNGIPEAATVFGPFYNADFVPLLLGANNPQGAYLAGSLDDVRLYGRALSDAEIQTLAIGGS